MAWFSISRKVLQIHKPDPLDILYWIAESEKGIPWLMKKKRRMLFEEVECLYRWKNSGTAI